MSSVIQKLSLHVINALSVHLALSPPNPPVKRQECSTGTPETDTLFEHLVQHITFLSKSAVWFSTSVNIAAILLEHSTVPSLFAVQSLHSQRTTHPLFVLGVTATFLSALLRRWCYKALGSLFTFEIALRPKHQLITHGPYAWVRHPSYTGLHLTLIGATLAMLSPGTWTADHGIRNPLGALLLALWMVKCLFACRGMYVRLRGEDELLRATFGLKWEEYRRRVPWKYLPGLY